MWFRSDLRIQENPALSQATQQTQPVKAIFIRKYCPELKRLDNKQIHNPSAHLTEAELAKLNYPKIVVNLAQAREQTLGAFQGY